MVNEEANMDLIVYLDNFSLLLFSKMHATN